MLLDARCGEHVGIRIINRTNGHSLGSRHMLGTMRLPTTTTHDLLFADIYALNTVTNFGMQRSTGLFAYGCVSITLNTNTDETVVTHQSHPTIRLLRTVIVAISGILVQGLVVSSRYTYSASRIHFNASQQKTMDNFVYLGSPLSRCIKADDEVAHWISKASQAFVYTREARFLPPSTEELPTPSVSDILFSEGIVRRELEALNESKSPGPDEIPPKLLKELASELSVPSSMLFQTSFDTGTLPIDWKLRTLLRSTKKSWTRALDDRHEVPIAFIDFQKAFDTVPHQRLLHKLKKIGIGGNFLKWIENILLGRHQVVCIGQGKSDPAMVESGVPRGFVLGPILFLIYVDDAARAVDCEVAMFADDMKIWSVIRGPADEDRVEVNLNRLEEWSSRWLLRFNVGKCSIVRLGNAARSASTRDYFLGGAALQ
ncbi:hypothetical protein SprV_0200908200 [Sparganum proliferum]